MNTYFVFPEILSFKTHEVILILTQCLGLTTTPSQEAQNIEPSLRRVKRRYKMTIIKGRNSISTLRRFKRRHRIRIRALTQSQCSIMQVLGFNYIPMFIRPLKGTMYAIKKFKCWCLFYLYRHMYVT